MVGSIRRMVKTIFTDRLNQELLLQPYTDYSSSNNIATLDNMSFLVMLEPS